MAEMEEGIQNLLLRCMSWSGVGVYIDTPSNSLWRVHGIAVEFSASFVCGVDVLFQRVQDSHLRTNSSRSKGQMYRN